MSAVDPQELVRRLAAAWDTDPIVLPAELVPAEAALAYRAQLLTLAQRGWRLGAWKVGAKTPDGPAQGAPLPPALNSPATLPNARRDRFIGLELEIAFRIGRRIEARATPYTRDEVLAGVDGVCAAIELVASRQRAEPVPSPLAQLADLQNHGALVAGDCIPYEAGFPFEAPALSWQFEGRDITPERPANPAGDPRRLLAWVVNHSLAQGLAVEPGTLITTGTYTGAYLPSGPGTALGRIAGLPPVQLSLS
ncbi:MAG TPA: fumarylacetoacetate hydrolase family protein [Roseateles sp.]|nr:fumarylacetoacetate hydrolase family protein [Roseateles sp.]